jgi:hypothetical protein
MPVVLDLSNDDFDAMDPARLAAGWYRAKLDKLWDDEKDGKTCLRFQVTAGPFNGSFITWKLGNPELAGTIGKQIKAYERLKALGKRLGTIYKDEQGRAALRDWQTALGGAYVIKVEEREYEKEDGGKGQAVEMAYLGVYPLDHPEIPAAIRLKLGLPLLPGQSPPEAGSPVEKPGPRGGKNGPATKPLGAPPQPAEIDVSGL